MNIYEINKKTGISLKKLRKLDSMGVLKVESEHEASEAIRHYLARNNQLTVAHILQILDKPRILDELDIYEAKAARLMLDIGNVEGETAPIEVFAEIAAAAKGKVESARIIADWLKKILPSRWASHYWVAVRLLAGEPKSLRNEDTPGIGLALMAVRKLPEFKGYWFRREIDGKNQIFYMQRSKYLDL